MGFAVLHLAPGGPLSLVAAAEDMSPEDLDQLAAQMGLNDPLPVQYLRWPGSMLPGDWGRSYRDHLPVLQVISSRLGATLQLMVTSTAIAVAAGGWIGLVSGINRSSGFDTVSSVLLVVLVSIPTFWLDLVSIFVFALMP